MSKRHNLAIHKKKDKCQPTVNISSFFLEFKKKVKFSTFPTVVHKDILFPTSLAAIGITFLLNLHKFKDKTPT